jgi:hypothetical protein
MSSDPPKGKITWDEIANKFPAVMKLVTDLQAGVAAAQIDGKVTGAEMGDLMAVAAPQVGRLVDEIIADAAD